MTTVKIPISSKQEGYIKSLVKNGFARSKAAVLKRVFNRFMEEDNALRDDKYSSLKMSKKEFLQSVRRAEKQAANGDILYGNLRELLKHA